MRLVAADSPEGFADAGAEVLASAIGAALASTGTCSLALSGGRNPWPVFARLAEFDLDWSEVHLYQVDERVVPADDERRNLVAIKRSLLGRKPVIHPMPIPEESLDDLVVLQGAARRYSEELPDRIDVVQLGLGVDGHTASLVLGDPLLDEVEQRVAISEAYQGTRRMTLTFPALAAAGAIVWLVTGDDKRAPLAQLLAGDQSIPASHVPTARAILVSDLI